MRNPFQKINELPTLMDGYRNKKKVKRGKKFSLNNVKKSIIIKILFGFKRVIQKVKARERETEREAVGKPSRQRIPESKKKKKKKKINPQRVQFAFADRILAKSQHFPISLSLQLPLH